MEEAHQFTWLHTIGGLEGAWEHIGASILVVVALLAFALRIRGCLANTEAAVIPEEGMTARNIAEAFVEAMIGIAKSAIPEDAERVGHFL